MRDVEAQQRDDVEGEQQDDREEQQLGSNQEGQGCIILSARACVGGARDVPLYPRSGRRRDNVSNGRTRASPSSLHVT